MYPTDKSCKYARGAISAVHVYIAIIPGIINYEEKKRKKYIIKFTNVVFVSVYEPMVIREQMVFGIFIMLKMFLAATAAGKFSHGSKFVNVREQLMIFNTFRNN